MSNFKPSVALEEQNLVLWVMWFSFCFPCSFIFELIMHSFLKTEKRWCSEKSCSSSAHIPNLSLKTTYMFYKLVIDQEEKRKLTWRYDSWKSKHECKLINWRRLEGTKTFQTEAIALQRPCGRCIKRTKTMHTWQECWKQGWERPGCCWVGKI